MGQVPLSECLARNITENYFKLFTLFSSMGAFIGYDYPRVHPRQQVLHLFYGSLGFIGIIARWCSQFIILRSLLSIEHGFCELSSSRYPDIHVLYMWL